MKRFLAVFLPAVILLEACSNADTSSTEEVSTFSNELYTVAYESTIRTENDGSNFSLSFSIAAEDETRQIDSSDVTLRFPERLSDDQGNSYQTTGDPHYSQKQQQSHIVKVEQSFSGPLHEESRHLTAPLLMVIDNNAEEVLFQNVTADSFPLTREELTITNMERNGKTLNFQAEDHISDGKLDWSMNVEGEKIYPAFTNTVVNNNGTYEGSLEFAFQPADRFSITAGRSRTEPLEWELPFVLPVS
ncbi:hypothetical protein [Salibacterium qingdaonense]|uniref:Intracellular proteinase inhibitor n=1 Tax=Salibacterium qingdaonense TaxID=266892 RepID=A0A1I4IG56_9BACI|nr:hypothetical protein [Salibacterium qingdaonense]SFL53275.1 hypothetical protein SAMN04488054_10229 [Salibacterium qingdaonense]